MLRTVILTLALSSLILAKTGEEYFKEKKFEKAIEESNKILKLNPKDFRALRVRAKSYRALGDYKNSNLDYLKLLQMDSDKEQGVSFLVERGAYLKSVGDTSFVDLYKKGLEIDGGNIDILNQLSTYYLSKKDYSRSLKYLDREYEENSSLKVMAKIAKCNFMLKNYDRSAESYTIILDNSKKSADLFYNRGLSYFYGKHNSYAYNDFLEAINIDPNYVKAYNSLAKIDLLEKRFDDSIKHYSKSIDIDPNNFDTYYKRSKAYLYKKQLKKAASDLKRYLKLGGKSIKNPKKIQDLIDQLNA
ncbi:MAG: hypothetical protein CR982_03650 [Candidatus Cloacimonadota bacterium]|nr:MAG: hypothetical protein CR982_03650 [Candidatus Cloacimonadota bacterium]PIE78883.1 MAG: hypothetical protein CSA15_05525 [Candidatus Delongbacteria bacterium]